MSALAVFRTRAPAKLNLGLEVLGRRPDGFHEIESIFVAIDLADELVITAEGEGIELAVEAHTPGAEDVPDGPSNLVWRAAEAGLRRLAELEGPGAGPDPARGGGSRPRTPAGLRLALAKHVPSGAGLGGGSSDAASVLRGVASLGGRAFRAEDWADVAASLGSDVPFFLGDEAAAVCRGRGEAVEPLPLAEPLHFVVVETGVHCGTAEVYGALDLRLTAPPDRLKIVAEALRDGRPGPLARAVFNRLEDPAFRLYPELRSLRDAIAARIDRPMLLTGSGSSLFTIAGDADEARQMCSSLSEATSLRVHAAASVPLRDAAARSLG